MPGNSKHQPKAKDAKADADEEPEVVHRFWGVTITPGKDFTFSLERTELHVTNAAFSAAEGAAVLTASTPNVPAMPICTLVAKGGPRQALLDVNFFPEDESVTLRVEGTAPVTLVGSVAVVGGMLDPLSSDDDEEGGEEEEEEEEEEEASAVAAAKAKPAPAPAPAPAAAPAAEKTKRKRQEDEEGGKKGVSGGGAEGPAARAPKLAKTDAAAASKEKAAPAAAAAAAPASSPASAGGAMAGMKSLSADVRYKDLVVGTGPRPTRGKRVTLRYVGSFKDGRVFDKGNNFKFKLGAGAVIRGMDEGVATMNVGGKRVLIIHPNAGYGSRGASPIPPNATLVFEIELLRAEPPDDEKD